MKAMLSLCILLALAAPAQAQDGLVQTKDGLTQTKPIEKAPVPDLNKSQWAVEMGKSSNGLLGSSTTTIKRHIGPGLWLGGQMKSPYREPAAGGQGAPGNPIQGVRNGTTVFGPVLEMRF